MSGFAVALRTDGAPLPRDMIARLTATLAVRGPDHQATWCAGAIGLGHAQLQIGSDPDSQPLTLDGTTWIVADARIDDRDTLAAALDLARPDVSDAELILRAFLKWNDRCVDHLLGDFAFAIWDSASRHLLCARDHLGITPLHYAVAEGWLLVSSSVDTLRHHPAVSNALDDEAVADFLLFGHKTDPAATTFRDIRRVPPAHTLTWSLEPGCCVRRYWELPIEEPVYRKDREYAAALRELLDRAVADRLRRGRVGIFFSGGLDSTIVAAAARRHVSSSPRDGVRAFFFAHDTRPDDDERGYAAAAAAHLGIECRFYDADASAGWRHFGLPPGPEPLLSSVDMPMQTRCLRDMAAHSRIAFSGEGPDNALTYEWRPYLAHLSRTNRYGRMLADALGFVRHHRRVPLASAFARGARPDNANARSPIPAWISRDLVERLRLDERWRVVMRPAMSPHPTRPAGCFSLALPLWQTVFDEWDPSYTRVPLEVRHPFLDVRLLRFLLAVPAVPWCREKHLLRYAFRDELPAMVRGRPKAPLQQSPQRAQLSRHGLPTIEHVHGLDAYASTANVDARLLEDPARAEDALRLVTFGRWLSHLESAAGAAAARD